MLVSRPVPAMIPGTIAALVALVAALAGLADLDLYRPMTPDSLLPGTISQDLMTVLVAAGILAAAPRLNREAGVLWLVWLGGIGYLAYAYAIYAFEGVMNPLFLAYVAVLGLAIWAVIGFFAVCNAAALSAAAPPRRLTAGLFALLVVMFASLWLTTLIPAMISRERPEGLTIFILDLGFVLPLLSLGAVLLWRARPMGDLLAVPLLLKAGTIGISVLGATVFAPRFAVPVTPGEILTYTILGLLPLVLAVPWLRRLSVG